MAFRPFVFIPFPPRLSHTDDWPSRSLHAHISVQSVASKPLTNPPTTTTSASPHRGPPQNSVPNGRLNGTEFDHVALRRLRRRAGRPIADPGDLLWRRLGEHGGDPHQGGSSQGALEYHAFTVQAKFERITSSKEKTQFCKKITPFTKLCAVRTRCSALPTLTPASYRYPPT